MRTLKGSEYTQAWHYFLLAAEQAKQSTCNRARCGTVIVNNTTICGKGYNSPAGNLESRRMCFKRNFDPGFKSDKSCCVHPEQRAIMDALRHYPENIQGSQLYFMRLDPSGSPLPAGEPYCTICSKMSLDSGIGEFLLWNGDAIISYPTEEYDRLSYAYPNIANMRLP